MTSEILVPDSAVEAAARAMADDWNPGRDPVLTAMFRDYAASVLTAAAPHIAAQATRDVRAERDSILRRIDRLESDESWWIGGAWGDYGEAVIPLRALSTLTGPLVDAGPEWETKPEFAATYGDLRATVEKQASELSDLRARIEALRDEIAAASPRYAVVVDRLDALLRGA